jgi:serine/threonine protein kinase
MDKTIIESDTTVRESTHFPETTQRDENNEDIRNAPRGHLIQFQDYTMVEQLPTTGREADVYIISKNENEFILKLYRHEMKPSREMVERLVQISDQYPEDIIRIYEIAKDEKLNRWYELQEFAKLGTLKNLITNDHAFALTNIRKIVEEITLILKTIHNENIIHRDIKPDNILVRTKDPLDLIITDFGISSVLDEEMSKKMTTKSGTKIYFAPESFSGVIGKEVDYWALGMIILEILNDGNLFSGESDGLITYTIFTKGIEIPSTIPENLQLLLKGLLTRDPKQRWNHIQIFQWLNGETDIPTFHNYNDINTQDLKSYTFKNEKFYDIKNLLLKMYSDEHYDDCKEHIMRGYITKWLEENNLHDDAIELDNYRKNKNVDLAIHNIYNHFTQTDEFIFMGKLITINNLLKFTSDSIDKKGSDRTNQISKYLIDASLYIAYLQYRNNYRNDEDLLQFLYRAQLSDTITETYYLARIMLMKNSLAFQLINHDKNHLLVKSPIAQQLFNQYCNTTYVHPKAIVNAIVNKQFVLSSQNNEIYLKTFQGDELFFNKLYFLQEKEIREFLNYKEFFTMNSIQYEDILNDYKLYQKVFTIIYGNTGEIDLKKYAEIFNQIYNNSNFMDHATHYIGDCDSLNQKLLSLYQIRSSGSDNMSNRHHLRKIMKKNNVSFHPNDSYEELRGHVLFERNKYEFLLSTCKKSWSLINTFREGNVMTAVDLNDLYDLVVEKIARRNDGTFSSYFIKYLNLDDNNKFWRTRDNS